MSFFAATIAELAHGEKSYTHSLNHSPRLFDASGSEACTSEKIEHVSSVTCECNWLYTAANTFALKISCTYVSKTVNTQNFLVNLTWRQIVSIWLVLLEHCECLTVEPEQIEPVMHLSIDSLYQRLQSQHPTLSSASASCGKMLCWMESSAEQPTTAAIS